MPVIDHFTNKRVPTEGVTRKDRKAIRAAVQLGVELLDKKFPTWFKKIDLKVLDLTSRCNCIGGQLAGHYFGDEDHDLFADTLKARCSQKTLDAIVPLDEYGEDEIAFVQIIGFCTPPNLESERCNADIHYNAVWQVLDDCWVREIRRRLRAVEPVAA